MHARWRESTFVETPWQAEGHELRLNFFMLQSTQTDWQTVWQTKLSIWFPFGKQITRQQKSAQQNQPHILVGISALICSPLLFHPIRIPLNLCKYFAYCFTCLLTAPKSVKAWKREIKVSTWSIPKLRFFTFASHHSVCVWLIFNQMRGRAAIKFKLPYLHFHCAAPQKKYLLAPSFSGYFSRETFFPMI